jgi:hypothetical protein
MNKSTAKSWWQRFGYMVIYGLWLLLRERRRQRKMTPRKRR